MANYTLSLAFSQAQLEVLYMTGSNIVVAKPTEGSAPNVAWQVFRPMEANSISWEEQYGIYASTAEIHNGAKLSQLSRTEFPATGGGQYTLSPHATFGLSGGAGERSSYYATNSYPEKPFLTFGLFQDATVNGQQVAGNAISAAPVLLESTARMTPYTTLYVWVQSEVMSNTVVTQVTSPQTKVVFGGGVSDVALEYESAKGIFVAKSGLVLAEEVAIDTAVPSVF